MKKTLRNIVGGLGLLTLVSGCTGMGAVMSTSNDPRTRLIGNVMYHESSHQDRMKEAGAGRSEVNVYGGERQKKNCIYKIINLDTYKTEIEVSGNYIDGYFHKKAEGKKFSKNGYLIIINGGEFDGVNYFIWKDKHWEKSGILRINVIK